MWQVGAKQSLMLQKYINIEEFKKYLHLLKSQTKFSSTGMTYLQVKSKNETGELVTDLKINKAWCTKPWMLFSTNDRKQNEFNSSCKLALWVWK